MALPLSAPSAFDGLLAPRQVVSVRQVGVGRIGGVDVAEYEVRTELPASCLASSRPAQAPAPRLMPGSTLVWLDGAGRVVQVRSSESERIPNDAGVGGDAGIGAKPGLVGPFAGSSTSVVTLTLSGFDDPVRIVRPHDVRTLGHSFAIGMAVAKGCTPAHPVNP